MRQSEALGTVYVQFLFAEIRRAKVSRFAKNESEVPECGAKTLSALTWHSAGGTTLLGSRAITVDTGGVGRFSSRKLGLRMEGGYLVVSHTYNELIIV